MAGGALNLELGPHRASKEVNSVACGLRGVSLKPLVARPITKKWV